MYASKAMNVAKTLEAEGIDVEVIDPRTLVPMDTETMINSVKKTGRAVVVHEAHRTGGPRLKLLRLLQRELSNI